MIPAPARRPFALRYLRTYDKNVRKYRKAADDAYCRLMAFADKYGPVRGGEEYRDGLCEEVDAYIHLNFGIYEWCRRSGVNVRDFVTDIYNYDKGSEGR